MAVHEVRIVEITRFRDVSDVLADADIGHEHPAVREAFREGHLDAVVLTVQFRIVVPHHIELAPGCRILVVHRHLPPAGGFRNLDRRVPRSGYGQVPAADDPANSSTVVPDGRHGVFEQLLLDFGGILGRIRPLQGRVVPIRRPQIETGGGTQFAQLGDLVVVAVGPRTCIVRRPVGIDPGRDARAGPDVVAAGAHLDRRSPISEQVENHRTARCRIEKIRDALDGREALARDEDRLDLANGRLPADFLFDPQTRVDGDSPHRSPFVLYVLDAVLDVIDVAVRRVVCVDGIRHAVSKDRAEAGRVIGHRPGVDAVASVFELIPALDIVLSAHVVQAGVQHVSQVPSVVVRFGRRHVRLREAVITRNVADFHSRLRRASEKRIQIAPRHIQQQLPGQRCRPRHLIEMRRQVLNDRRITLIEICRDVAAVMESLLLREDVRKVELAPGIDRPRRLDRERLQRVVIDKLRAVGVIAADAVLVQPDAFSRRHEPDLVALDRSPEDHAGVPHLDDLCIRLGVRIDRQYASGNQGKQLGFQLGRQAGLQRFRRAVRHERSAILIGPRPGHHVVDDAAA